MPLVRHLALAYPGDDDAVAADDEFLFGPDLLAAPVTAPGDHRALGLPAERALDPSLGRPRIPGRQRLPEDGALRRLSRAAGASRSRRRSTSCRCSRGRARSCRSCLRESTRSADDYEYAESTSLAEGSRKLVLLAFPRGKSKAPFFEGERVKSKVRRKRERWILKVGGDVQRTYALQASLATLADKLVPCRVKVDGERLRRQHWDFRKGTEVLTLDLRGRSPRLVVEGRC